MWGQPATWLMISVARGVSAGGRALGPCWTQGGANTDPGTGLFTEDTPACSLCQAESWLWGHVWPRAPTHGLFLQNPTCSLGVVYLQIVPHKGESLLGRGCCCAVVLRKASVGQPEWYANVCERVSTG